MNEEKIRCKKCGSAKVYLRIKTYERVCQICGYIESIKKNERGDK